MSRYREFRYVSLLLALLAIFGCAQAESGDIDQGDLQVIEALKDAGSDLAKPHPIDFYCVEFPDRKAADAFAQEIDAPDWKVDVHQTPDTVGWTVVASTVMVPEIHAISHVSARFSKLASKHGGDYDGWEAAVTK
jgi:hypothetical protein